MSRWPGRGLPLRRFSWALLLAVLLPPGLVLGGFALAWGTGLVGPPGPAALDARATRIERWLHGELGEALGIAEAFLGGRAEPVSAALTERLDGVGILDADLNYLSWRGTPPEPDALLVSPGASRWHVRGSGVHVRLVVRAGPDNEGRCALASLVVDSRLADLSAKRWIPTRLLRGVDLELVFGDDADGTSEPTGTGIERVFKTPDGAPFVAATLRPVSSQHAAAMWRNLAWAWAAIVSSAVALALVPWTAAGASSVAWGVGAIVLARIALAVTRAPAWVLAPELGTAKAFGTSAAWRLTASPADLVLSALAAYGVVHCVAAGAERLAKLRPAGALAVLSATAAASLAWVAWILGVVARSSSVPLLDTAPMWRSGGRLAVGLSVCVALLGAADLLAALLRTARREPGPARVGIGTVALLLGLVVAASLRLQHLDARAALERIRSEYAALVLDPLPARKLALASTLERVREAFADGRRGIGGPDVDRLAYELWVESELFFGGYRSSLDLYDAGGVLRSHFGFDLPLLAEDERPAGAPDAPVRIREGESFRPVAAVRQQLLHGAVRLGPEGALGWVVGHVLDEPANLPFLPGSRTYLAALGPGAPFSGSPAPVGVEYVLYDASGTVVLSTLIQPPAMSEVLVEALEREGRIDVAAGDERWAGIALQDGDHRLHALLQPSPGILARLAAAVRLALLAAGLVAVRVIIRRSRGPGSATAIVRALRASFYGKLLAALLVASTVPLLGLGLVVRGYIDGRGRAALIDSATQFARAAQRVLDDYIAVAHDPDPTAPALLNDEIVYWLRNLNGQEIHVYENARLKATSRRELFASGAVPLRLDGHVQERLGRQGSPYVVVPARLGSLSVPIAYAPLDSPDPQRSLVAAVPVVTEARVIVRSVQRVADTILLATVLLAGLLAVVATYVARTVARPVRDLVHATARIAMGDYGTRLRPRTSDELAELVRGFNSMAASLATQRADLERRREYTERLLEHATTGVLSLDRTGSIVTLNPATRRLLETADVHPRIGESLGDALGGHPDLAPLRRLLERSAPSPGEPEEIDLVTRGMPRRLRVVRVPLADPEARRIGTLVLLDDVTDLMRSNQLAAWAEMARAIAHEIKNPLTPIQLSTEHLERLLRDRSVLPARDLETCIETVKKQVRALYDIAGEFSTYAKLPVLAPLAIDPVEFLREVAAPYRAAALRRITLEERYEPTGLVAIDARVLGRAIVNLIENAMQAMPDGGRLTLAVRPSADHGEVVLSVEDTGTGITAEVRRRLFEPYFSTKSSGTGLGLAIVRRAVEAHAGRIEVDGEPGHGTTFRIRLPRIASS